MNNIENNIGYVYVSEGGILFAHKDRYEPFDRTAIARVKIEWKDGQFDE